MKCKHCGSKVDGNFCQDCGTPVEKPQKKGCLIPALVVAAVVVGFSLLGSVEEVEDSAMAQAPQQTEQEQKVQQAQQTKEETAAEPQPQPADSLEDSAAEIESSPSDSDFGDGNSIEVDEEYVLNTSTLKFHRSNCQHVGKIEEENFATCDSREDAISNGYQPCKVCNP